MTAWLAETLVAVTLLMLLVLALRQPVAHLFGAGWAYALWMLPALRLLLPPLPQLQPDLALPSLSVVIPAAGGVARPLPGAAGYVQWVPVMLALWAGGVAVFLLWQFIAYRRFVRSIAASAMELDCESFYDIVLVESRAVDGPLAVGLIDRLIVLPRDFGDRYSPAERRLALEHELIHHRRGDIWWNMAALGVLAFNWFNPIAYLAFRAFRTDQELACDAAVVRSAAPEQRHDYARALVKSASRPGLIAACPLNHADQLKRRLKMMKEHRMSRLRSAGGAVAVTVLAAVGLAFGSPGIAQKSEPKQRTERIIIMESHSKGEHAGKGNRDIVIRRGANGEVLSAEGCGGEPLVNLDEGDGKERTKLMLCTKGDASAAGKISSLERARTRIAENDSLSSEHRQRVQEALNKAIARLRSQQ